jgi:choline dehydrogenase-like flavoprotein
MVYTRGTKEDYDRYAKISGDPGWGWDKLQRYFRKVSVHCSVYMEWCIYYPPERRLCGTG